MGFYRNPFEHSIKVYSESGCDPDDALSFLSWVPDSEITDQERCHILRATLETVMDRLRALENTRG